jgi:hypothetical protein
MDQAMAGVGMAAAAAIQPVTPAAMMQPTGPHGPIGQERNWLVILVVSCICFIAGFWYYWNMVSELNRFRQKEDLNPILILVAPLLFFLLPDKVLEAKRMAGVPNPTVQNPILYVFLGFYFFPNDLNEIWQAASKAQPR